MSRFVERFEDMSPRGLLRLHLQEDGDVIIDVVSDPDGMYEGRSAHVEFCTPFTGGGQSERTWKALRNLYEAMEADNKERQQNR